MAWRHSWLTTLLAMQNNVPMPNHYLLTEDNTEAHAIYILELCGKLVMAVRRDKVLQSWSPHIHGTLFLVFELVEADTDGTTTHHLYKWEEMTSLGDYALFLGPTCAKTMHLSTTSEHGGP